MTGFIKRMVFTGLFLSFQINFSYADEVDLDIISKIRDEGFNRSQVMETLRHLSDNIGPRLTGSPSLLEANHWTRDKLAEWGLDAHLESFEFGRGWTANSIQIFMTSPRKTQLSALPLTWTTGTKGEVEAQIFYAPLKTRKDFKKYKGRLKGKIVFISRVPRPTDPNNQTFIRYEGESLKEKSLFNIPTKDNSKETQDGFLDAMSFLYALDEFLAQEGAIAQVRRSHRNGLILNSDNYQYLKDKPAKLPGISLGAEHYDRAVRLMNSGQLVRLSLNVDVTFHEKDTKSYSTIAEIPGKGRKPQIVMAGGHLDSWASADGSSDNGAGVAVVMEAVRILRAIGIKPKRTIRVGLWGGEEQGIYGSAQYVHDHFAIRPDSTDERLQYLSPIARQFLGGYPIEPIKEHGRFSVYFNLDHGSGKIRGIYAEENSAAAALFKDWLVPFHDLEADTVTLNKTGGTDHVAFDQVGLPGFQFIQDPLDYMSLRHHTQLDVYRHTYAKDLKQASVILASFLYNAAMRKELMPRKVLPAGPNIFSTVK